MTREEYITKRRKLFWFVPDNKLYGISDGALVEAVLNYGTLDDVKELFRLMGIKNVAKVFFDSINQSERKKNNYLEITVNYFTLLFNKYAH